MSNTTSEKPDNILSLARKRDNFFTVTLVIIFLSLGLIGILNHEMWFDELQAWMIARDSSSINNLFQNLRYEGHPGLWHIGLYVLSRFTDNPVVMQLYHLLIATTGAYVFIKYSPFNRQQKIFLSFGYFSLYEYGIISRSYVLGLLFIYCFCTLYPHRDKSFIPLSLCLLLLCNTHVYGFIIAISLLITLVFDTIFSRVIYNIISRKKLDITISLMIFLLGAYISLKQVIPPSDSYINWAPGWRFDFVLSHFIETLLTITRAYLPLQQFGIEQFWGTNALESLNLYVAVIIAISLFIFSALLFIRQPVVLLMYLMGTLGVLSFTYTRYIGHLRHHGHLFLILIACLWISHYYSKTDTLLNLIQRYFLIFSKQIINLEQFTKKYHKFFIQIILYTHLIAANVAFTYDLSLPFSQGKAAAAFIKNQHLESMMIIGYYDDGTPTISGYLNKSIFYPQSNRLGTFTIWNKQRKDELSEQELLGKLSEIISKYSKKTIILLNILPTNDQIKALESLISQKLKTRLNIKLLQKFERSIYYGENFYLFTIK
jgi:hypothetical protein